MEEKEIGVKNIKASWYYFLNFYFWASIILIISLVVFGTIIYFKFISPNIETWIQSYDFILQIIDNTKPLAEEYLNLTLG